MSTGNLKIHSENILPIIKQWLYTDKEIFARELVSNACDAIHKLGVLGIDDTFRIDVKVDKEAKTLTFSDNGIGMDAEEVEKYIAQIAFSGAEEFVSKYKTDKQEDQIIGHFGLGFYSAYMVASKVEIQTLSHKEGAKPVRWECDGSSSYTIEEGTRSGRGTDVILHISDDEYLDPATLRRILTHYCAFLPYPIYLEDSQINEHPPLWLKSPSDCTDEEYLTFYRQLFPFEPDPLFWIHLNTDFPFHVRGILYFPKIPKEGELKRDTIKLFCNRVFVSDNCKDLLPDYLMILRGALDSPDIPLNVSRSTLQMDKTVRQLGAHISKKITDKLAALYRSDRDKFLATWEDVELIVKYGSLQDDKFYERAQEFLVWKTCGGEWVSTKELAKEVLYTADPHAPFLSLYKEKQVLEIPSTMLNNATVDRIERKGDIKFRRIDAALDDELLDPSREKSLLDAEGKTEAGRLASLFQKKLGLELVEAKSLASDSLPAFLMIKEEERRMREALAMRGPAPTDLIKPTLVINTNSKLIQSIENVNAQDPDLAKEMCSAIYDLARLSQREMDPAALPSFIERNTSVLEKLAEKLQFKN